MAMSQSIKSFLADESGATAIEYGLIMGLMVVAIVAGMTNFADANNSTYQKLEDEITG
jgi:pilus assembly protein Flp/PilA